MTIIVPLTLFWFICYIIASGMFYYYFTETFSHHHYMDEYQEDEIDLDQCIENRKKTAIDANYFGVGGPVSIIIAIVVGSNNLGWKPWWKYRVL